MNFRPGIRVGMAFWLFQFFAISNSFAAEAFFDSSGVRLRYLESGRGEPVILLHGFAMPAVEAMWIKNPLNEPRVIPYLEKDFRVIALEFRGHGRSDKPHDPKQYGHEMSDDVVRLMDHLKIDKAHVVGYSLGAAVSGKLLVTYPDRLLSVTFGGGAPVYQPSKEVIARMYGIAESLERKEGVGDLIRLNAPSNEPPLDPVVADQIGKGLVRGQDQAALAAVIRGIVDQEVTTEQLQANKVPVTFIYGNREGEAKGRIAATRKVLTGATETVIDGGEHINTFATVKFRKAIRTFLLTQKR